MLVFVSGGVRSGKSSLGERLASELATGRKIYLATAKCADEEILRRIERHRKDREHKGFVTMEKSEDLETLRFSESDTVLLDCLGTLASNEMFRGIARECTRDFCGHATDKIFGALMSINDSVRNLIVISNEVFSDGVTYESATEGYVSVLGALHVRLAKAADRAVECACGIHVCHKGELG